ncbi:MAG: hypothetical protein IKY91_06300 [Akkermansia sp.]|nr:hypothetical protein [Akkermansia sp.]
MNKVLDLNTVQRPTLELTLMDDARTTFRVSTPTEAMVQELQQMGSELESLKSGNRDAVATIYNLAARLISCNRDYIVVTAEELRSKYRMDLESAILFFSAYMDFISAIQNEKN